MNSRGVAADERDCDRGESPKRAGIILQTARMPRWSLVFDVRIPGSTAEDGGLTIDSWESPEKEKDDRHDHDEQDDPHVKSHLSSSNSCRSRPWIVYTS